MIFRKAGSYLVGGLVLGIGGVLWYCSDNREEEIATPGGKPVFPKVLAPQIAAEDSGLAALRAEIAATREELSAMRQRREELVAQIPCMGDEILMSFGRPEDMGEEIGEILGFPWAMTGDVWDGGEVEGSFLKMVAWSAEIKTLEARPQEIAALHSGALATLFEFTPDEQARVGEMVEERFAEMVEGGLTAVSMPDDAVALKEWKARRSMALAGLMHEIRPFVSGGDPGLVARVLPAVLNVGVGMERRPAQAGSDGVTMGFPDWPPVPW